MDKKHELTKIRSLTNFFGIYQHGRCSEIDKKFGFALEDQARALLIASEYKDLKIKKIYRDFIVNAYKKNGQFCQFYYEDIEGKILKTENCECSEEAMGVTLWALLKSYKRKDKQINEITTNLIKNAEKWEHIRSLSCALLGLTNLKKQTEIEKKILNKILKFYKDNSETEWQWFEHKMTYANAIIPWALWQVAKTRKNKKAARVAESTTNFLIKKCQKNGIPMVVGCNGWHKKGECELAEYDQQPIDAAYMVCCLETAYEVTKNEYYLEWLEKWWEWFYGNNLKGICMIDNNGACYDGITIVGVNENQGAESNICYLMALGAIKRLKKPLVF